MITLAPGAFKHRIGGRFNAAMWFWETADLPLRSRPAFHLVDELWVASEYERDVFGQYARVPVHVIGLAADLPHSREVDRSAFGWRDDELVFLFVYDALSSYGRKNPGKALEAFIAAFAAEFRRCPIRAQGVQPEQVPGEPERDPRSPGAISRNHGHRRVPQPATKSWT